MKTEELIALGVSDEIATKILVINGKDIEKHKTQAETYKTELDGSKAQLVERDKDIEELKKVDAKGLQAKLDELQGKYDTDTKELSGKLSQQALNSKLDFALTNAKAKNLTAVKALLKTDSIKLDGENLLGLTEQLETITKDNPYLFGEVDKNPPPGGGGDPTLSKSDSLAGALAEHYNK